MATCSPHGSSDQLMRGLAINDDRRDSDLSAEGDRPPVETLNSGVLPDEYRVVRASISMAPRTFSKGFDTTDGASAKHGDPLPHASTVNTLPCIGSAACKSDVQIANARAKLAQCETKYSRNAIPTLHARWVLGDLLRQQCDVREAKKVLKETLRGYQSVAGSTDMCIKVGVTLAIMLHDRRMHKDSEAYFKEALNSAQEQFGPGPENTMRGLHYIGLLLMADEKYNEAMVVFDRCLRAREEYFGNDHHDTLRTVNAIGSCRLHLGRFVDAEKDFLRVVRGLASQKGSKHPDTLMAMANLSYALKKNGQPKAAIPFCLKAVHGRKETLGLQHPHTVKSMASLAELHFEAGQVEDATDMYEDICSRTEAKFGLSHAHTLAAKNAWALCLLHGDDSNVAEARQIFNDIYAHWCATTGASSEEALIALHNIASLMHKEGALKEAVKVFRQIVDGRKSLLGPEHKSTIQAKNALTTALIELGDLTEAESVAISTHEEAKSLLGTDHATTLETKLIIEVLQSEKSSSDVDMATQFASATTSDGLASVETIQ